MSNSVISNTSIRIHTLVVDNSPIQCQNVKELLLNWGYRVSVATARIGKTEHLKLLREDVLQKMQEHPIQIALIDMRLENDESKEDNSGQKLAEELLKLYPDLQVVMRSGYQEPRAPDDWKSIEKGAGAEKLKLLLEETLTEIQGKCSR